MPACHQPHLTPHLAPSFYLCPQNILLDEQNTLKLIDFGLAAFFQPGKTLKVHCGSPSYAAPEIVGRKHYEAAPVDVWSLGVVLFATICGFLPFHASGGNKQDLCNKILTGSFSCPDYMSPGAKDLLHRMLTVDPVKRITLDQVRDGGRRLAPQPSEARFDAQAYACVCVA